MKIIVIGGGKVGTVLCEQLVKEGHNLVLVDQNAEVVEAVLNTADVNAIVGNGVSGEILTEAGVSDADLAIACTPSDEQNILCCMIAKKLGAKQTIARVRNPEYFNLFISQDLGLNMLVNPEYQAAYEIAQIVGFPYADKVASLGDDVKLIEYTIPQGSKFCGVVLKDIANKFNSRVLVTTVIRDGVTYVPKGDFVLAQGDKCCITADEDELYKLFRNASIGVGKTRNVFLLGGTTVAFYLANNLAKSYNVTIIEKDHAVCQRLADTLKSNVKIINANGFNQRALRDENLDIADVVVALSDDEENNILISMFVHSLGQKVIIKVDKSEYIPMLENVGINRIVSPKHLTANEITKFVRSMKSGRGGSVCSVYSMLKNEAEFIEFEVGKDFRQEGVMLKDIRLQPDTIIVSITHNEKTVVPNGLNTIKKGDHVVVATLIKGVTSLNEILG